MPELLEVETVVRSLARLLIGRRIVEAIFTAGVNDRIDYAVCNFDPGSSCPVGEDLIEVPFGIL